MERTIVLVDDHSLFRNGLRGLLEHCAGCRVVGEAASGEEFLAMLPELEADIVFMDFAMPGIDGAQATERALARRPELRIITLSMFGEESYYSRMVQAGARGFLLKDSDIGDVIEAIDAAERYVYVEYFILVDDETTAPVLDPGRGRTKTGQLFAYARDDRPWGGSDPPGVAYLYAPDRKAAQPIRHLAGFVGVLQVDGYAGYRVLAERNAVSLAFCWSHVRRRFYDLAQSGLAPIATEALTRITELYRIEADIRGRPADERRAVRQQKSRAIVDALQPWLRAKLALVSQKSKLAEAIRYALARWQGLSCFLDDGRVEIDSNVVERAIRPIALNRKNALFAGSDGGGEHWATIASLVETCKLNGVDPQAYLAEVIARIVAGHPQSQIDDLLPWTYATAPLKAVA